jgi:hypothetical protein
MLTIDEIEYAPASKIVEEVKALRETNAPTSIIEVLLEILKERKEHLENLMQLTENSLQKCFQEQFILSLIDNYKYYKKEIKAINSVISE